MNPQPPVLSTMEKGEKGKRRPLEKVSSSSSYVGDRRRRRKRRRERRREIFKGKRSLVEEFGDREIGSCLFGRGKKGSPDVVKHCGGTKVAATRTIKCTHFPNLLFF